MQLLKRLIKNSIIYLTAQLGGKILVFLLLIYMARTLGPTDYGKFAFSYALMNLFGILAKFGLESLISRDVAQDAKLAARYLGDTLQLHTYLGLLAFGLMLSTLFFFQKSFDTNILILFLGLAMILGSMAESFSFTFASQERFTYHSILFAGAQALTFIFAVVSLQTGWLLPGVGIGFAGAALIYLIAAWRLCAWKIASPLFVWDIRVLWQLIGKAVPFAVASIFVGVYYRIDVLILSAFTTDQTVGWYDAAYNFVWALKLPPSSLAAVLLPMLSKMYLTDKAKTLKIFQKIVKYVSLVAIPIIFVVFVWAEVLIALICGPNYQESAFVLRWLVGAAALMFINAQLGTLLIAINREKQLLRATAVGAIVNIIFNLVFIPYFNLYGAAAATVLSELIVGVICIQYSSPFMTFSYALNEVVKPFIFLLITIAIFVLLKLNPSVATIIALVSYIAILKVFSLIPSDDFELLRTMLQPRPSE